MQTVRKYTGNASQVGMNTSYQMRPTKTLWYRISHDSNLYCGDSSQSQKNLKGWGMEEWRGGGVETLESIRALGIKTLVI